MNKILITGGAGFIGSHLVDSFLSDYQVIVVDNLSTGLLKNLPHHPNLKFICGDVCDQELTHQLFLEHQFDFIYHLAAVSSVQDSVNDPLKTHQVNFDATLGLLESVRETQKALKRFVFSSSAAVYGDLMELPKLESSPVLPKTPYAIDKYASERYTLSYFNLYKIPTSAVRFFNVYGSRQNPASPYSGVISLLSNSILQARRRKAKFTIFGDGRQTRDFIHVQDVVQALHLISKSEASLGEVYNVGTGNPTALLSVIETYSQLAECEIQLSFKEQRSGDIQKSYASIDKLQSIGFEPKIELTDGLADYWQHLTAPLKRKANMQRNLF